MRLILIIEDEAAIRRVLVKILGEESDTYIVEEAEDGVQAVELCKKHLYNLIFMDIISLMVV